jgi:hypothetical protein
MLFLTWKASGADPYQLYNGLDASYRPIGQPDAEPRPPRFPERVRCFIYAMASYARELERTDLAQAIQGKMQRGGL